MPRRHLLTAHNILFTCLTVAFLLPKVLSTYLGGTLSLNTLDWVLGGSIALLFYWLGELRECHSDRWRWYFEEHFPSMVFHFMVAFMRNTPSRYPVDASTNAGQIDTIQLRESRGAPQNTESMNIFVYNVTEESTASHTEQPIFHSSVEAGHIDQLESGIPNYDLIEAQYAASPIGCMELNPMSNVYPLSPAEISPGAGGDSSPGSAEGIREVVDRMFQRSAHGITEEDGRVDISSTPLGTHVSVHSDRDDIFQGYSTSVQISKSYAQSCSRCRLLKVRCDIWQRDGSSSGCSRCDRRNLRCELIRV